MAALTVPVLPPELVLALPAPHEAADAATDKAVTDFLGRDYSGASRPDVAEVHPRSLAKKIEAGESRHESTVGAAVGACKDAAAGLVDPRPALDTIEATFLTSATKDGQGERQGAARTPSQARAEWQGIRAWAVAQALACDPETHRSRVAEMFPPKQDEDTEAAFWDSTSELRIIRDFALARFTSPWAVLGVVLTRVADTIPPGVVLPPTIGGTAPLNQFVALVGRSGSGKGAAERVAREVLTLPGHEVYTVSPASGEGIIAAYFDSERVKGGGSRQVRSRDHVMFSIPEVDALAAVGSRSGSTIDSHLRSLWIGEDVGSFTSDPSRRRQLEGESYRAGLVVGVQPSRAGALLDAADGGTPQRFIWLPATDARIGNNPPAAPKPIRLAPQPWPAAGGRHVLTLPGEVETVVIEAHLARQRDESDALDGHALLARLKVAQLLTVLCGRRVMTLHDWERSGVVMAVSNRTRAEIQRTLRSQAEDRLKTAGRFDAIRAGAAAEVAADQAVKRVARLIRARAEAGEGTARSELRKRVTSTDREHFDDALARLVEVGDVRVLETTRGERVIRTEAQA